MARQRMIKPEFWADEKVAQLNYQERLLFIGLWTFAEDNGVGRANPLLLKANIFPYDATLREADLQKSLQKIASLNLIVLYKLNNQVYYMVNNFLKHQKINRPSETYLPLPDCENVVLIEGSMSTHGALTPNISEDKLSEVKGKEKKKELASLPFSEILSTYQLSQAVIVELQKFLEMRRETKKPITEQGLKALCVKLAKHSESDCIKALQKAIIGSWAGVFFPDDNEKPKKGKLDNSHDYSDELIEKALYGNDGG